MKFINFFQDIIKFARFRESLGVPVETVCFHDAEHVKLYTSYPQKYIQCVCTFISNCLTNIPIRMNSTEPAVSSIADKKFD